MEKCICVSIQLAKKEEEEKMAAGHVFLFFSFLLLLSLSSLLSISTHRVQLGRQRLDGPSPTVVEENIPVG